MKLFKHWKVWTGGWKHERDWVKESVQAIESESNKIKSKNEKKKINVQNFVMIFLHFSSYKKENKNLSVAHMRRKKILLDWFSKIIITVVKCYKIELTRLIKIEVIYILLKYFRIPKERPTKFCVLRQTNLQKRMHCRLISRNNLTEILCTVKIE